MNKILSDYEALASNDFWKMYLNALNDFAKNRMNALRTANASEFAGVQGELRAITLALSKPEELIKSLTKENEQNG